MPATGQSAGDRLWLALALLGVVSVVAGGVLARHAHPHR
jgi:hypothetical protein